MLLKMPSSGKEWELDHEESCDPKEEKSRGRPADSAGGGCSPPCDCC